MDWLSICFNQKDTMKSSRNSDNEKLEYKIKIKKRIQADIKRDIRDTRIGSGCNILHLRGCISGNYDTSNRQRR